MGLVANVDGLGAPASRLTLSADVEPEAVDVPPPGGPDPSPGPQDRIELFSLDGKSYCVPKRPGPNVAIRYLRDTRRHGREYAIAGLMEAMLGTDGMDALADYVDLTEEDLDAVMRAVEQHVLGPIKGGGKAGKR